MNLQLIKFKRQKVFDYNLLSDFMVKKKVNLYSMLDLVIQEMQVKLKKKMMKIYLKNLKENFKLDPL